MKSKLLTLSFLGLNMLSLFGQQKTQVLVEETRMISVPQNKYYGQNKDYIAFTPDQKKFNDWSVGVYAGLPFLQGSDFNTMVSGKGTEWGGYDFQGVLTKQITHAFALAIQFNYGKTKQQAYLGKNVYKGYTNYLMLSLQGDLNFSSLFRRVDNKSIYNWALHGYVGAGAIGYEAYRNLNGGNFIRTADVNLGFGSLYAYGGTGLRHKLNKKIDLEAKALYYFTGDESFDGSGERGVLAEHKVSKSDGFLTFSVGAIYKIGKHKEYLGWVDPLADIYPGMSSEDLQGMLLVCSQGDNDDDGVCDDWDRELNTPAGARVDGAGRALDTDLDGVIDLNDKCVTLPGPADNDGCPLKDTDGDGFMDNVDKCPSEPGVAPDGCPKVVKIEVVKETVKNINVGFVVEFDKNKATIRQSSYPKLDEKAYEIKKVLSDYPGLTLFIDGYTSNTGSASYNKKLSERRASSVVRALESRGIARGVLTPRGFGQEYPKCPNDTPEGRQCNRRVEVSVNTLK